ncbi:MAG: hypothetical protein QNJ46_05960 [Leptolyngbyaceae cyanobacterium MO_188.B28]|nr:hypothetical protein [Leptolyngbyaceae cyanobacterium MO_188.B28]
MEKLLLGIAIAFVAAPVALRLFEHWGVKIGEAAGFDMNKKEN